MREIKFRAWDKVMECMVYPDRGWHNINLGLTFDYYYNPKDGVSYKPMRSTVSELMQYTGLKDKNGVEIYEGDIVKWAHLDDDYPTVVEWCQSECGFVGNCLPEEKSSWLDDQCKVIGNIHENPELLA